MRVDEPRGYNLARRVDRLYIVGVQMRIQSINAVRNCEDCVVEKHRSVSDDFQIRGAFGVSDKGAPSQECCTLSEAC